MKIFERGKKIKVTLNESVGYFIIDKCTGYNDLFDEYYYEVVIGVLDGELYVGSLKIISELEGMKVEDVDENEFYDMLKLAADKKLFPFKYSDDESILHYEFNDGEIKIS